MLIKKNNYDNFFCAQFIPALKGGAFLRENGKMNHSLLIVLLTFSIKSFSSSDPGA